ncbi:MAG: acyltransferase family protein, partial [Candidatus Heimdallarchaeota archaeon]
FFYQFSFFLIGFILFADERIIKSIRRDWLIFLIIALGSTIILLLMFEVGDPFAWSTTPGIPEFYLVYIFVTTTTWCWINFILVLGMRFLDFSNTWLQYWKEAILPFYLVHQPIILIIAFFVVQWDASILIKLPAVVLSSFIVSLSFFEFIIKRIEFFRPFFGIKATKRDKA